MHDSIDKFSRERVYAQEKTSSTLREYKQNLTKTEDAEVGDVDLYSRNGRAVLDSIRHLHRGEDPYFVDSRNGSKSVGCKHYASMCEQLASCCGVFVPCRLCHDEAVEAHCEPPEIHRMDRFSVKSLRCRSCGHEQSVSLGDNTNSCASCHTVFADHACTKCMLFHDGKDRDVYHCDRCGICRLGKREENYHCETCDACVRRETLEEKSNHTCLENSVKGDCPICITSLFASVQPVVFLPCGHAIHEECFEQLCKREYRCCLCFRPFADMSSYYKELDRIVEAEVRMMPAEYASKKVLIKCSDCGGTSETQFHFQYLRCRAKKGGFVGENPQECGSYNTRHL